MSLTPGTRLGRIRIDALLGAGGMGEVYRGWDEKLERAVALKVVHADKRLSAAMRNRFLREARVLSKLDHPNIAGSTTSSSARTSTISSSNSSRA